MNVLKLFLAAGAQREVELFLLLWIAFVTAPWIVISSCIGGSPPVRVIVAGFCLWKRRLCCNRCTCEARTFSLVFIAALVLTKTRWPINALDLFFALEAVICVVEVFVTFRVFGAHYGVSLTALLSLWMARSCLLPSEDRTAFITTLILRFASPSTRYLAVFMDRQVLRKDLIEIHFALRKWKSARVDAIRQYFRTGREIDVGQVDFLWKYVLLCLWRRLWPASFVIEKGYQHTRKFRTISATYTSMTPTVTEIYVSLSNSIVFIRRRFDDIVVATRGNERTIIHLTRDTVRSSHVITAFSHYGPFRVGEIEKVVLALAFVAKRVKGKYACWAPLMECEGSPSMTFEMIMDTPLPLSALNALEKGFCFVDVSSLVLYGAAADVIFKAYSQGSMIHVEKVGEEVRRYRGPGFRLREDKEVGSMEYDVTDIVLNGRITKRWRGLFEKLAKWDNVHWARVLSQPLIAVLAESVIKWKYGVLVADQIEEVNRGSWCDLLVELCNAETMMLRHPYSFCRISSTLALETTTSYAVLKKDREKVVRRLGMKKLFKAEIEMERNVGTEGEIKYLCDKELMKVLRNQKPVAWVNSKLAHANEVVGKGRASCYFRKKASIDDVKVDEYQADLGINTDELLTAGWYLEEKGGAVRAVDGQRERVFRVESHEKRVHITEDVEDACLEGGWRVVEFEARIIGAMNEM